ncbi:hypothetical protein K8Z61_16855 [Nocardioides sp. TRM66260-LWL]|uniref:hypothetical protein n=1 Tax=Nocardioides sp. TRM66260-LWL TaxID=2874478 RepID=UPI001CC647C9|nr:hypothetical protein [Nocardioides sp. TRM66260-LWL]MBZ5736164.1 hypothetical protein [Nocardioides sp. TRM66260-LWL]
MHDLAVLAVQALDVVHGLLRLADDEGPRPEDVKAGWGAFAIFLGLCVVVGLLGWSLVRQLKKVERARVEGVFGEEARTAEPKRRTIPLREDDEPRA